MVFTAIAFQRAGSEGHLLVSSGVVALAFGVIMRLRLRRTEATEAVSRHEVGHTYSAALRWSFGVERC
jgi:hypothetical protein